MVNPAAWDMVVSRKNLGRVETRERPLPELDRGQMLLRIDRVGMTANNVTYALVGETMRYWEFFPTAAGWGRVPLWGFAEVERSRVPEVDPGTRYYGYLPSSSHLLVQPERVRADGFRDASAHRSGLPSPYNVYQATGADPLYTAPHEDLQILYRPLFITSFMLEDYLDDNDCFGAARLVLSSASSKTAYGAAFCSKLRAGGPRLVGLTSSGNVSFTESLGVYDEVVSYDDLEQISSAEPLVFLDFAGGGELRRRVHAHFGDSLRQDVLIGVTQMEPFGSANRDARGPRPAFFFAPDQIRKRGADWGRQEMEARIARAWERFVPTVQDWVEVVERKGPAGLQDAWLEVLEGRSSARVGNVIQM